MKSVAVAKKEKKWPMENDDSMNKLPPVPIFRREPVPSLQISKLIY